MKNPTDPGNRFWELLSQTDQGIVMNVHIQPRASRTEYVGLHGKALKFRISAPPVEGLANEALCGYLAKEFRISKGSVVICSGHQSRQKRILLKGVSPGEVKETLLK